MHKFWTVILCVILALGVAGCTGNGEMESSSSDTAVLPEGVYEMEEAAEQLGTVTALRQYYESEGENGVQPQEGNVFLLCEFRIENTTEEDISVSTQLCFTGKVDGKEVSPSSEALLARGAHSSLDSTMKAGQTLLGVVGFEVPMDWKVLQVDFKPDILKPDVISFAVTK